MKALEEFRNRQHLERELYGADYTDHDLICACPDGSPMDPDNYSSDVIRFLTRIGLSGVSFQKLRHSHASQLLRHNVHPKIVQERLGHTSISITLDLYSHVVPGLQEAAVEKLDSAISSALEAQRRRPTT